MIVAFTGHRPDKIGLAADRVRHGIRKALIADWPLYVICGMAQGVDTWAAETCLALGIPFVAAVPCDNMEKPWSRPTQERFRRLLKQACEVVVVSPGPYKPWKMQKRNEWMVDHCSRLLSVFDGSLGGTYNCLAYAAQIGRETHAIDWRS